MSFDDCYGPWEWSYCGDGDDDDDCSHDERYVKKNYDDEECFLNLNQQRYVRLVAEKVQSISEFKDKVFRYIVNDVVIEEAAKRYCKLENLPDDYAFIAMYSNALGDIIATHIDQLSFTAWSDEFPDNYGEFSISRKNFNTKEINMLIDYLYNNPKNITVYELVAELQSFVHHVFVKTLGDRGLSYIEKDVMRRLLSAVRLHLSINNLKRKGLASWKNEIENNELKTIECKSEVPLYVLKGNVKYYKNWSARHRKTLIWYASKEARDFIDSLNGLDNSFSTEEAVNKIITHKTPEGYGENSMWEV